MLRSSALRSATTARLPAGARLIASALEANTGTTGQAPLALGQAAHEPRDIDRQTQPLQLGDDLGLGHSRHDAVPDDHRRGQPRSPTCFRPGYVGQQRLGERHEVLGLGQPRTEAHDQWCRSRLGALALFAPSPGFPFPSLLPCALTALAMRARTYQAPRHPVGRPSTRPYPP